MIVEISMEVTLLVDVIFQLSTDETFCFLILLDLGGLFTLLSKCVDDDATEKLTDENEDQKCDRGVVEEPRQVIRPDGAWLSRDFTLSSLLNEEFRWLGGREVDQIPTHSTI